MKEVGSEAIITAEPIRNRKSSKGAITIGIHGNSLTKQLQASSIFDWDICIHVEVLESLTLSEGLEEIFSQVGFNLGVSEIESLNSARYLYQLHDRLGNFSI